MAGFSLASHKFIAADKRQSAKRKRLVLRHVYPYSASHLSHQSCVPRSRSKR
jgi:hypothetical protein